MIRTRKQVRMCSRSHDQDKETGEDRLYSHVIRTRKQVRMGSSHVIRTRKQVTMCSIVT